MLDRAGVTHTVGGFRAQNHLQQTMDVGPRVDVDERATPPEFFAALHARFRFTVDAAALAYNAKLTRYWTPADDGLAQPWSAHRVFVNPPFSDIESWLAKAWMEWGTRDPELSPMGRPIGPELIVMLLPANRTELSWWHEHVEPYRDRPGSPLRVEFLLARLKFGIGDAAPLPNKRPRFGCCLLIWEERTP
jgi:phage N-6-adenine-methyltransferase